MTQRKIAIEEVFEDLDQFDFPKYTTQLMNLANQNAQGTRPAVVGQMSELIERSGAASYREWEDWYERNYPDAIEKATEKVWGHIVKLKDAIEEIDKEMVRAWVRDLVITKTAQGLIFQKRILVDLADEMDRTYRPSTPSDESRGIDGYIGETPCSVKPETYKSKTSTKHEKINAALVTYKTTSKYLTYYYDPSDFIL